MKIRTLAGLFVLALASVGCSFELAPTIVREAGTDATTEVTVPSDVSRVEVSTTGPDATSVDANKSTEAGTDAADSAVADDGETSLEDTGTDAASDVDRADVATDAELPLGQPIVELFAPPTTALVIGNNSIRWRMRSTGRPIAVKKTEVFLWVHPFDEEDGRSSWSWMSRWMWAFTEIRFLRDGILVNPTSYRIVGYSFPMGPFVHSATVEFQTEEELDRDGHVYELVLLLRGALTAGDSIAVQLGTGSALDPVWRGRLTPLGSRFGAYFATGPHVWVGMGQCMLEGLGWDTNVRTSSFVWSDRSAGTAHSWADCTTTESSDDWFTRADAPTNQMYVLVAR